MKLGGESIRHIVEKLKGKQNGMGLTKMHCMYHKILNFKDIGK